MEALGPWTEPEEFLRGNFRLACQAVIEDPGIDVEFALVQRRAKNPHHFTSTRFEVDPRGHRAGDKVFTRPSDRSISRHVYGVAVDVRTTTIVIDVVDLQTAQPCQASIENPQRFGGSDVINLISYDSGPFQGELHKSLINALNHELKAMYEILGIVRHEVYEVVVVGNATMRDLFFNLDVQSIGQRPYKSMVEHEYLAGQRQTTSLTELAHRLGILTHPKARIFGWPRANLPTGR